ncbi:HDOD domain-containing protein [Massilia sp. TS11]|uniref:HDOD domain-containing protein n=1 Tax=Massilia sp. TS11 TaxID=2908003 RepID=UPI001EDA496A|nr:HDOD domain-containing protein [Massilia sp. TS11]MCG2586268.1 HDOD domain-containing protein [Massilia sp. TS11]
MSNIASPANGTDAVDALIKSIRIPPRPSLLMALQKELSQPQPAPENIARIISSDVGMSGALLKLANSAIWGGGHKSNSIEQAILFLGINQVASLMAGLLARKAIRAGGRSLVAFWDVSDRRAQAMVHLSRALRVGEPDVAHTFGLFADMGVPLLTARFPEYEAVYARAVTDPERPITAIEEEAFSTHHAAIGCLLARNWGLAEDICWGILHHHDYRVIEDQGTAELLRSLVALSLVAEAAIQKYQGHSDSLEWHKGGDLARAHLGLSHEEVADLVADLIEAFHGDQ